MLRQVLVIISLLSAWNMSGVYANDIISRADSAYTAERYAEAVKLYNNAIDSIGSSSDAYYNLGNAYFRLGKNAQAILAYERALRINPANSDARANLEFVNDRIVDKKGETGSFISNTLDSIANYSSSNNWAWIAVALFAFAIIAVAVYYFSPVIIVKKAGFFGGILIFLLSLFAILLSIRAKNIALCDEYAIITAPTTVLSTVPRTPSNRNEEAMLLHEGTKVRILNSVTFPIDSIVSIWHDVEIDNQHRAWINDNDIEKIL